MPDNQLLTEALNAIVKIKSTPEFCLFNQFDTDWLCLTKAEWFGWAQTTITFVALLIAILVPFALEFYKYSVEAQNKKSEAIFFWHDRIKLIYKNLELLNTAKRSLSDADIEIPASADVNLLQRIHLLEQRNNRLKTSIVDALRKIEHVSQEDVKNAQHIDAQLAMDIIVVHGAANRCAKTVEEQRGFFNSESSSRRSVMQKIEELITLNTRGLEILHQYV